MPKHTITIGPSLPVIVELADIDKLITVSSWFQPTMITQPGVIGGLLLLVYGSKGQW
jgi:hypothetical protein